VLALFGVASLAQADTCFFTGPGLEQCGGEDFGTSAAPPFQFTLPQFNPQSGELQSVGISFELELVTGTVSFPYQVDPSCANSSYPLCGFVSVGTTYNVAVSSGNFALLNLGNSNGIFVDYCCAPGNPNATAEWFDPPSGIENDSGINSGALNYTGAQVSPFIGSGQLVFNIATSTSVIGSPGTASVDSLVYGADITYNFTPATTPEPSLFFVTGAALLGLVLIRFRHRDARSRTR
jgi:hypothetical protein